MDQFNPKRHFIFMGGIYERGTGAKVHVQPPLLSKEGAVEHTPVDQVIRRAILMHIQHMMTYATPAQEAGFHRIFPKGIDNLSVDDLKGVHNLVRRTVEPNGLTNDEVA